MQTEIEVLPAYMQIYDTDAEEIVLYGSSGSGKTWAAIDYMIVRGLQRPARTFSVEMMATDSGVRSDLFEPTINRLDDLGIEHKDLSSSPYRITLPNKHSIIFMSALQSKSSAASEGALKKFTDATDVLINEVTEIRERDYMMIGNRMGRSVRDMPSKRIVTFNPTFEDNWAVQRWVLPHLRGETVPDAMIIKTTYKDAESVLNPGWISTLLRDSERNPSYARVYRDGLPGVYDSLIYTEGLHWSIDDDAPWEDILIRTPDSLGVDWGSHTSAAVASWLHGGHRYALQLFYGPGMVQEEIERTLGAIFAQRGWSRDASHLTIRCDHELDRIWSLAHNGGFMHHGEIWGKVPAGKYPGPPHVCIPAYKDVIMGIEQIMSSHIHVHPDSRDLIKELRNYIWDPSSKEVKRPLKSMDHACDALRYSWAYDPKTGADQKGAMRVKITSKARPPVSYGRH